MVAVLAVLLTVWHVFASFLWIFPPSPLRQLAPGDSLSNYMLPVFGQSWTVFAPEPINGDYHFNVRATVLDEDGEERETGWVSANQVELSMVINHLFPPRAGIQAEELASGYKYAWGELGDEQRRMAGEDFLETDWLDLMRADMGEVSTEDPVIVDRYLASERRATAYATQVAKAIWGEDVQRVQYRVSRQNVVPYAERHNREAKRPEPQVVLPGWREPLVVPGQDEQAFADVFQRQYERSTGTKVGR
ncbi:hypothetical protein D3230_04365 [Leucobacter chromiireducens subsp. solipictus]|uniref:Band 7 domain-containing protein n=1 Tax=Leucobacter chromiireducens subsp. solipictus TaxID=398235 RepID=A0ABS1SDH3_9MICO|nr:hypothetical protein [Leucobacter chromiireducens subsp. solipictus]